MTLDHTARYLLADSTDYIWVAASFGRWAFPFFAALLAWHALFNSRHLGHYSLRILIIGLVAQPGYAWMLQQPLAQASFNICFTLFAGLLLTALLKKALVRQQQDADFFQSTTFILGLIAALLAASLIAPWLDYGLAGILLTPALAVSFYYFQQRREGQCSLKLSWSAWLLPGFLLLSLNPPGLPTFSSYFALFLLIALIHVSQDTQLPQPRFPRALWLSWYPLHLVLIASAAQLLA